MSIESDALETMRRGQQDYIWHGTHVLDMRPEWVWHGMRAMAESLRDNEKTCVYAGHGVSKTYSLARFCLSFLFTHPPCTVITTAPTSAQVEELLWREIRQCHSEAKVQPLGGQITRTKLDLQEQTGFRWFALGFATKPDTVTHEATAFQGYHNDNMLIAYDEAAAILPEIWRASLHIGAPYKRWLTVGNATAASGDFAACNRDPSWHKINLSVLDTPNYKQDKQVIPGVYGRDYVRQIEERYGRDSDEFRVRVLGQISEKPCEGAYYFPAFNRLESQKKLGKFPAVQGVPVNTVWDPGYTTAIWFYQVLGSKIRILHCYEESGWDMADYAVYLAKLKNERGWTYGKHFSPSDIKSNAYRLVDKRGLLELAALEGLTFTLLGYETAKIDGIDRVKAMLPDCEFNTEDSGCQFGVDNLKSYHEKVNKAMSTEEQLIFTGVPAEDGPQHVADAFRYLSKAVKHKGYFDGVFPK
jgi:hypothetical protein